MTYREVWRLARTPASRGGYDRTGRDVLRAWADLARASRWLVHYPLMLVILGYGQPKL